MFELSRNCTAIHKLMLFDLYEPEFNMCTQKDLQRPVHDW